MKIRHYGPLGNRNKKERIAHCKELTNTQVNKNEAVQDGQHTPSPSTQNLIMRLTGIDITKCRKCGSDNIFTTDLPDRPKWHNSGARGSRRHSWHTKCSKHSQNNLNKAPPESKTA